MLIHHSANLDYRFDQLFRCEDVTQAQGWVEDLAHGAGVDDAPGVIESLQTWEWGTGITKFRVVIVLENVSVAGAREIDQSRPSREAHRHTERELMGRSHVNYFGRALFRRPPNRDSFPVNRPRHDNRSSKTKGSASLVKSRILYPCNLTPIYEGHCTDHHCLLCSSGADSLVWMTMHTPVITQISC